MTTAMPMPAEETVDLEDPRAIAACQVMGITRKDLHGRSRESFLSSGDVLAEARFETFERKRRLLLKSIVDFMENQTKLPEAHAGFEHPETSQNIADIQRKEQENLDKLRIRAKKDVQKIAEQELGAKKQMADTKKKQEESQKRFDTLQKARDEALKLRQAEAQKKQEKGQAVREKADDDLEKGAQELMKSLVAANKKAKAAIEERDEVLRQNRVKKTEEWQHKSVRQHKFAAQNMQSREQFYADHRTKHQAHAQALYDLQSSRVSNAEALRSKLENAIENAKRHMDTKEREALTKHDAFLDHEDVVVAARISLQHVRNKEMIANHKKAFQAHEGRYEKVLKDTEKRWAGNERLTRSFSDMSDLKSRRFDEQSKKVGEMTHLMDELVAGNRQRLTRAHRNHQNEALHKVEKIKNRMQDRDQSLFNAQQRRYEAIKTCSIEKMELQHQVDMLRDCKASRMNRLLVELGLETAGERASKKDDEGEAKDASTAAAA